MDSKFKEDYLNAESKFKDKYTFMGRIKSRLPFRGLYARIVKRYIWFLNQELWSKLKGTRVLDAGIGGNSLLENSPTGKELYGIDISESFVKMAKDKGFNVKKADCRKLPFRNEFFDNVYSSHVIEHIPDPENAVAEFKRVLKKGGTLFVRVPNVMNMRWHYWDDYTHIKVFTPKALYRLLFEQGFENIKIESGFFFGSLMFLLTPFPRLRVRLDRLLGKWFSFEIWATCSKSWN